MMDRAAARYMAAGAACLFVFVLMALGVTGTWNVVAFDQGFADWVAGWRNPALTDAMLAITSLGDGAYLRPMGALVVIALAMQRAMASAVATGRLPCSALLVISSGRAPSTGRYRL